jgi:hypothetical protein
MGSVVVIMDGSGHYGGILILESIFHSSLRNQFDEPHILSRDAWNPKSKRP